MKILYCFAICPTLVPFWVESRSFWRAEKKPKSFGDLEDTLVSFQFNSLFWRSGAYLNGCWKFGMQIRSPDREKYMQYYLCLPYCKIESTL